MQDEVSRLLFLLYDKYQGNPGPEAKYVDMSLSFGPIQFLAALSNRTKTFVGSSNMSGFVSGNRVIVILSDVKSAYSLVGHATHKVDHYRSSRLSIRRVYVSILHLERWHEELRLVQENKEYNGQNWS